MTLLRILTLALVVISLGRADDLTDELMAATRKGDLAKVKALLDKGAGVNSKSPYGSTPLFFACDRGYLDIARLLIERGADVNVKDTFYGATALSWAMQNNHPDVLKLLLDHGAKSAGEVVVSGAQMEKPALVKVGLDNGPIDKETLSRALGAALKSKNNEVIEMLKAAGATPPEPVKTVELEPAILESYVGAYSGGRGGTEFEMTFTVKGNALSGVFSGQPALTYAPSDKTHFHSVEFDGINLEFSDQGFKLKQGGQEIEFKRKVVQK
jgi:Ankyrin repeats (3 copies)/Ankyrin repeat